MSNHFRPAPLQFVLAIKRRLEKSNPTARLDEKSVRLVAIPRTHFDATVFMFEHEGKTRLIAEIARPDLPHIFAGKTVDPNAPGTKAAIALAWVVASLGWKILHDPRFRPNVIRLNGFARA